jgi:hypothetical protein
MRKYFGRKRNGVQLELHEGERYAVYSSNVRDAETEDELSEKEN